MCLTGKVFTGKKIYQGKLLTGKSDEISWFFAYNFKEIELNNGCFSSEIYKSY